MAWLGGVGVWMHRMGGSFASSQVGVRITRPADPSFVGIPFLDVLLCTDTC
jgi:hypothetical protein